MPLTLRSQYLIFPEEAADIPRDLFHFHPPQYLHISHREEPFLRTSPSMSVLF